MADLVLLWWSCSRRTAAGLPGVPARQKSNSMMRTELHQTHRSAADAGTISTTRPLADIHVSAGLSTDLIRSTYLSSGSHAGSGGGRGGRCGRPRGAEHGRHGRHGRRGRHRGRSCGSSGADAGTISTTRPLAHVQVAAGLCTDLVCSTYLSGGSHAGAHAGVLRPPPAVESAEGDGCFDALAARPNFAAAVAVLNPRTRRLLHALDLAGRNAVDAGGDTVVAWQVVPSVDAAARAVLATIYCFKCTGRIWRGCRHAPIQEAVAAVARHRRRSLNAFWSNPDLTVVHCEFNTLAERLPHAFGLTVHQLAESLDHGVVGC